MEKEAERMKRCTKCGVEYPANTDYFHKHTQNGLHPRCKVCRKETDREHYRNSYSKVRHVNRDKEKTNESRKLHRRIRQRKELPDQCTICNKKKKLDICSINHTYTEDPKDWIFLCRSCHMLFDSSLRAKTESVGGD